MSSAQAGEGVFHVPRRPRVLPGMDQVALAAGEVDRVVVQILSIDVILSIIMQRIYVGGVWVTMVSHFAAVAALFIRRRLELSTARVILFSLFIGVAAALQIVLALSTNKTLSAPSLLLLILCYLPFLFVIPSNRETYVRVVGVFQMCAIALALLIFMDFAFQFAGLPMPSMDDVIPLSFRSDTYVYIQPMVWKRFSLMRPNAYFMLEAANASQFVALGLLIEIVLFRRVKVLALLAAALLGSFSGTGIMLMLLTLPIAAHRLWRQLLLGGIIALPLLAGAALYTGWYDVASARATSFDKRNSSANDRFVKPFTDMWEQATSPDPTDYALGLGAGQVTIMGTSLYNAMTKVSIEYGVPVLILFMIFMAHCFFGGGVPFVVGWMLAIEYYFMGGHLLLPPLINICYILAAGWKLDDRSPWPDLAGIVLRKPRMELRSGRLAATVPVQRISSPF